MNGNEDYDEGRSNLTSFEHRQLKGITVKNIVVTIISTASIVISVMTTYFQLKADIEEVKNQQETQARVNEIRLKTLETNVSLLEAEVNEMRRSNVPR